MTQVIKLSPECGKHKKYSIETLALLINIIKMMEM
jgi:hypothetical protein